MGIAPPAARQRKDPGHDRRVPMTPVGMRLGDQVLQGKCWVSLDSRGTHSVFVEVLESNWYTKYSIALYTVDQALPSSRRLARGFERWSLILD